MIENEYEMIELEEDELEENQQFTIDTPSKADWAIEKIKIAQKKRDMFVETARERISYLQVQITNAEHKCEQDTSWLTHKLRDYFDEVDKQLLTTTKTKLYLTLPSGKLIRTTQKAEMLRDGERLLKYVKENAPDYIKQNEEINWNELKKDLEIDGETVVRRSTGEVVDGITVELSESEFEIK